MRRPDIPRRRELGPVSRQRIGLVLGPILFGGVVALAPFSIPPAATGALASTLWIATWWVTEAIPIPATSLLPIVLFPVTGVLDVPAATAPYADPIVFLLLGGFLLALAVERWGLHRRIALEIVSIVGTRPRRVVLGFMLATAFLSMWISNSATAMLMVPIGTAVVVAVGESRPDKQAAKRGKPLGSDLLEGLGTGPADRPAGTVGLTLLLAIAYSASIGGAATLIGSPPNAVFAGVAASQLGLQITFLDWLVFAGPLSVVFLLLTWQLLIRLLQPSLPDEAAFEAVLDRQREDLGRISKGEKRVLAVFVLVAAGWLLRPFVLQPLFPAITDPLIAIVGGLLLFVVPVDADDRTALLDWTDATALPWGVLLLLGAGFSLAEGFRTSGLDQAVAAGLTGLVDYPSVIVLAALAIVVVLLTEVTSNTATASVFMPIVLSLGISLGTPPVTLMATTALAASMAFMLPVATPPNAIVFGSGYVTIPQMARVGVWLNVVAVFLTVGVVYLWLPVAFSIVG